MTERSDERIGSRGFPSTAGMPDLAADPPARGFADAEVAKIMGGNRLHSLAEDVAPQNRS